MAQFKLSGSAPSWGDVGCQINKTELKHGDTKMKELVTPKKQGSHSTSLIKVGPHVVCSSLIRLKTANT